MSWAEVFKMNNNMKRTLNEQLRDIKYNPIRVITQSGDYTPEKTGLYKVICIGAGGASTASTSSAMGWSGGAGGVAISTKRLKNNLAYPVTVTSGKASFNVTMVANPGKDASTSTSFASGGTATGGDYNFQGGTGDKAQNHANGGSVGVAITDLVRKYTVWSSASEENIWYGDSILSYGAGAPAGASYNNGVDTFSGLPAAILIIPIEMEE